VKSSGYRRFIERALDWFDLQVSQSVDSTQEAWASYAEERAVWTDLEREIVAAVGPFPSLETFLRELDLRSKEPRAEKGTVLLMTIHGAKGKEFEHVYLIGLAEDVLPSYQAIAKGTSSTELEEERRDCFVAITRTEKVLTLSFAGQYFGWKKPPSHFLDEMGILRST